jgi:shikimate kinase
MENIILIGMPGCGKSTVGVVLAKALGYKFIDSALLIQETENRRLSEILEQDGPDHFNEIENRINLSDEREPLYEKYADIILDVEGFEIRDVVKMSVQNI